MKIATCKVLSIGLVLFGTVSCIKITVTDKGQQQEKKASPVVIHDTIRMSRAEWEKKKQGNKNSVIVYDTIRISRADWERMQKPQPTQGVRKQIAVAASEKQTIEQKKYNVVIASLSRDEGVAKLRSYLESLGISYQVMKGNGGLNHFIVYSADSRAEAVQGRSQFLASEAIKQNSQDLKDRYLIDLQRSYVLGL